MALWVSIPSGNAEIAILRNALAELVGVGATILSASSVLKVLPLYSFCPPLPIGSVYVGSGSEKFGLKPSAWLNPFDFIWIGESPLRAFARFSRLRPDLMNWLLPLTKGSVLVCDCLGVVCRCHACVLMELLQEFSRKEESVSTPEDEEMLECPECEPEDADDDLVIPENGFAYMG